MKIPVDISNEAWEEIISIFKTKNIPPAMGLRLGIKGHACAGEKQFLIGFDTQKDTDAVFSTAHNIKIYIEKKHLLYLAGVKLHFINTLESKGFTFVE